MQNGKKALVHFGDERYEQFKDKLGEYSHLDHNDPKRKKIALRKTRTDIR